MQRVVLVVTFVACLATAAPLTTEDVPTFDVDRDLMDAKAAFLTKVPCAFCEKTMEVLLEQCKIHDGHSTDHIEDFMTRCSEIGGLQPGKLDLMMNECSETELHQNRVNFVYERRLRCAKIYRAMLDIYSPYDPCLQIRTDFQRNPMAVCHSAGVDCAPPAMPGPPHPSLIPPFTANATGLVFQPPPWGCRRYLSDIITECSALKRRDFYAKSNLKSWCSENYNGTFQAAGCLTVTGKLSSRDSFMDVCNGLKLWPIKEANYDDHCIDALKLSPTTPVMVPEFKEYIHHLKMIGRTDSYYLLLNTTTEVSKTEPVMIP